MRPVPPEVLNRMTELAVKALPTAEQMAAADALDALLSEHGIGTSADARQERTTSARKEQPR